MPTISPTATNTVARVASKVPEVTAVFWVLKLLTTAMGEATSDFLVGTLGPLAVALGAVAFALSLWLQFRLDRYRPFGYWGAVMMVAVFGTMAADVLHHELHVPLAASTLLYGLAVAATFLLWHRAEGTLSMHSITTRRREVFYWLAVTFTFALGTAAGDLTASGFHLGFAGSIVLFAVLMAMPAIGGLSSRLNSVAVFWWAYILTRPLGASIADWLGKPARAGGLGYGDGVVAATLLAASIALLGYLTLRRPATDRELVPEPV
ncbi:putative membrane-anchored protein [Mycobacterium sp. MAA66]